MFNDELVLVLTKDKDAADMVTVARICDSKALDDEGLYKLYFASDNDGNIYSYCERNLGISDYVFVSLSKVRFLSGLPG